MFDLVLAYMFVYFEELLRDYLLFEVARSQIGCDVCLCEIEKRFGLSFV